jgi:hypothetical protein
MSDALLRPAHVLEMRMTKKLPGTSDTALKKMLKAHGCPLGLHAVRMRFLGHLIAPEPGVSPIAAVQGLWLGQLPEVDHIDKLNEILEILMRGIWNPLALQVRVRRDRINLAVPPAGKGVKALGLLALLRLQELQSFEEGLLGGAQFVDIPQPAAQSMRALGEMAVLFATVHNTIKSGAYGTAKDAKGLRANVSELTKVAEIELNSVIDACLVHLPDAGGASVH